MHCARHNTNYIHPRYPQAVCEYLSLPAAPVRLVGCATRLLHSAASRAVVGAFSGTMSKTNRRVGESLRQHAADLHALVDHLGAQFPDTLEAVAGLDRALTTEFPNECRRRRGKPHQLPKQRRVLLRLLRKRLTYANICRKNAETALTAYKEPTQLVRQRLTVPWLVRLCLTAPIQSGRAFASVHADLTGTADSRGCSRRTINRIRTAFVQVCLKGNKAEIQDLVERIYQGGSPGRPAVASSASLPPGQICGSGPRQVHDIMIIINIIIII
jgi:hypothetical protein